MFSLSTPNRQILRTNLTRFKSYTDFYIQFKFLDVELSNSYKLQEQISLFDGHQDEVSIIGEVDRRASIEFVELTDSDDSEPDPPKR